ncbi:hypothetical protein C8F04DRAFT_1194464 [Mycena alexandri]|uniref:Uncharacterized protein n=1 Tax=Mycena alexandri TaxID=1745969 RepID=A0AAD6S994_9AGAR|nr:hypothetical protein C8F04DRAFT_1194464 [Mycena alexandri]
MPQVIPERLKADLEGPIVISGRAEHFPDIYLVTGKHVKRPRDQGRVFLTFLDFSSRAKIQWCPIRASCQLWRTLLPILLHFVNRCSTCAGYGHHAPIEVLAERLTRAAKLAPHLLDAADKLEKLSSGSITVYLLGSTMLWALAIAFLTATDSASSYRAIREGRVRWPRMEIQLIWAAYQEVCELPVRSEPHPTLQIVVPGISIPDLQVRASKL